MLEKIHNIETFFLFIKDFDKLIRDNSRVLFKCENKEFEKKYGNLYKSLKKFYKFVFNIEIQGDCSQIWIEQYYRIKNLTLKNLINMSNIEHKIKKDKRVYTVGSLFISWETTNLTNEICELLYKKDPSAFEFYDKDWRKKEQLTEKIYKEVINTQNFKSFFVQKEAAPTSVSASAPVVLNTEKEIKKKIVKRTKKIKE